VFIYAKSHLTGYKNKYLVKQTINNNRIIIADKLYDLSHVFGDIANCFEEFKKSEVDDRIIKKSIVDTVYSEVCKCCNFSNTCPLFLGKNQENVKNHLEKIVEIGLAKDKITFMDTPKEMTDNCTEINPILYAINKKLNDYKSLSCERENLSASKELIAKQADGVAKMLNTLAYTTSSTLKFNYEIENEIVKALLKKGINPLEVLIFTNNNQTTISLLFANSNINVNLLEKTVSYTVKKPLKISNAVNLQNNYYITLTSPKRYKTIYGIATATKTLSEHSGDTHTEVLISNNKVLYAISDGMGSGKIARKISTTTLTLIESFYKAGLPSETVLPLVNKILTLNTDDNFSALDIIVIDLENLFVDFIKFGAPRGYLITERGIKIVEGNTLPIGILKEVQPVVASTTVKPNDVLVLVSDGIHDAFNSTSDIIDYLKDLTALNPQSIAESLLNKAKSLSGNLNFDDMTALCVRIIDNSM
jgi:stage II sporulation protein E